MRRKKNGIVQKKRRRIHKFTVVGFISVLFILFLMLRTVFHWFQPTVAFFEVQRATVNQDRYFAGIIRRDEVPVLTRKAGHILTYVNNLNKVASGDLLYFNDEEGDFHNVIREEGKGREILSTNVRTELQSRIENLITNHNGTILSQVRILDQYLGDLSLTNISKDELLGAVQTYNRDHHLEVVKAAHTGIFVNSVDGMEGKNPEEITGDTVNDRSGDEGLLQTNTYMEAGRPIAKIITSENWSVTIPITEAEQKSFQNGERLKVRFLTDNRTGDATVELTEADGGNYLVLHFTQGVIRYAHQRKIGISIPGRTIEGMRIPKSALVGPANQQGVYVINSGVARFYWVRCIHEEEDFYIVALAGKLKPFDFVSRNGAKVREGERVE